MTVQLGDNSTIDIHGHGTVTATIIINSCKTEVKLNNVALAPSLAKNLISHSQLAECGH